MKINISLPLSNRQFTKEKFPLGTCFMYQDRVFITYSWEQNIMYCLTLTTDSGFVGTYFRTDVTFDYDIIIIPHNKITFNIGM